MTDFEDLFPPKPGGMVDTVRRASAQQAAQTSQLGELAAVSGGQLAEPTGYEAVRVRADQPDLGIARTVTLSASNPVAQLLPRDLTRRGAVVLAVDNDCWLSYNEGTAQDLAGTSGAGGAFYLPAGIGIPVDNQAQLWVSPTTTATNSRVSVLASLDSPP